MKKITKIALALAASVFVGAAFVGCAEEEGETGNINEPFSLTNDSESASVYKRGYKTTKTKHTSAVAQVTLPSPVGYDKNATPKADGVVGLIFHVQENDDGSKNFGIVGLRRNANAVQYYISYYKNVSVAPEHINLYNNFTDINGDIIGESAVATEHEVVKAYGSTGITAKTGEDCIVTIELLAAGPDKEPADGIIKDGEGDGSYKINIYDGNWTKEAPGAVKATAVIPANDTGDSVATQYKLGLYTNAYPKCTLSGNLTIVDTVNECEIELED